MITNKKLVTIVLSLIICLNLGFQVNAAVVNKPTEHIANVVYFVNFKDSQGNFMDGKVDKIKDMFDGPRKISLSNYIKTISYDQMNVHNYFPQEKDGEIIPYTLSNNRSYYNKFNEYEMISEIIKNVPVDSKYDIDMNKDGYVDNAIFIFGAKADQENDVLWAHKANHNGATLVNGKRVDNYNVHNSYSLMESLGASEEGVLAHEFLHSVGYPDLYRATGNGAPVGRWDIMASTSVFLQYPLAYTRSSISNWITIDTITESGTYKLKPSSNADGDQAFILKTPLSENEFFVVEYRKQGNPYQWELEGKIPGSGLIIYRVNTEETSNYVGDKDYIYIFRPGETEEGAGNGNLSEAFLSKQSGRTSYGSDDFSKKIKDNAITYSTGQNSGIVIENVSEAGEEISFDVRFTDTSDLEIWDLVGNDIISGKSNSYIGMDVVSNKIYTVYNEGDNKTILKAKMFDGSKWVSLGESIINETGSEPKIKVYNDIPYVIYNDKNYRCVVTRFINGKWETVETLSNNVNQYSDMIATEDGIYVALTDPDASILKVLKLNLKTNKFEQLGGNIHIGYIVSPSLTTSNGQIYISFNDFNNKNKVYVKKYENGNWINIEGLNVNASSTNIKAYGDKLYIALTPSSGANVSEVYVYNGVAWSNVGSGIGGREVSDLKIDVDRGTPYVAYVDNVDSGAVVKYFNGTEWVKEGSNVSDEKTTKINFNISNGKAYVALNSYNSQDFFVKSRELKKLVLEDVNNDGQIDILDISCVATKYNVNSSDSEYSEELDINRDGIIDIYDIIILAKKI